MMLHVPLFNCLVISVNNSSQTRRKYIPVYAYQYMMSPLKAEEGREGRLTINGIRNVEVQLPEFIFFVHVKPVVAAVTSTCSWV